jgi:hypothetical protein
MDYEMALNHTKNRPREIKHENCKTFCEVTEKFMNPSYIWEKIKMLKIQQEIKGTQTQSATSCIFQWGFWKGWPDTSTSIWSG